MSLTLVTAATAEPLISADIQQHARFESDDEDTYIDGLIASARSWAETCTKRQFVTATYRLGMASLFDPTYGSLEQGIWTIRIPNPPLQSVSSITYVDGNGSTQTLASSQYIQDTASEPGRITPAYNVTWPTVRHQRNSVLITFVAGYGAASAVPEEVKTFIKFAVTTLFEHREASPEAVFKQMEYLLDPVQWGSYA